MNSRLNFRVLAAWLLLAMTPLAIAQFASTGEVEGRVKDSSGAVVQDASVQLIDTGTKIARTIKTNSEGRYVFNNVAPGNYDLTFAKVGFAQDRLKDQQVEVGQALTLDVALRIGATATTIDVEASAGAELQTANSTVGSTLSGDSLLLLPNLGRDASSSQPRIRGWLCCPDSAVRVEAIRVESWLDTMAKLRELGFVKEGGY